MTNNTDPVRALIHAWRTPEPDNGEPYTEYDEGFDAACEECADALEKVLASAPPSAPADVDRLVRELDVALNGPEGAAPQASLCDLVGQVQRIVRERGAPLLAPSAPVGVEGLRAGRDIVGEFLQCANAGRVDGKLIAQAKDWLAWADAALAQQPAAPSGADCDVCGGTGEGGSPDGDCAACRGIGRLAAPQQPAGVDEAWRQKAAEWLEAKAVEQEANNQRWPDHAAAYKEWRDRPGVLRYLAAQVLAAQPQGDLS